MTQAAPNRTATEFDLCESDRIIRLWNALPPETSPAQSAGSLFDGDEGRANVRFGPHSELNSDIAACPKSAKRRLMHRSKRHRYSIS